MVTAAVPLGWLHYDAVTRANEKNGKAAPKGGKNGAQEDPKGQDQDPENASNTGPDCDWVIDRVLIIDGSGQPPYHGKVAVKGDKIVAIGDFPLPSRVKVIDGKNLALAPGFIDLHTHTEDYLYAGGNMSPFLSQGITTQIGGNCGRSPKDIAGFFATVPKLPINYGLLMGYTTLRQLVHGRDRSGKTTLKEQGQMQEHLAKALADGAVGLSVGLEYWPQTYATTEELISLCQVVKDAGGFYSTHIRSEYDGVLEALEEAILIANTVGIPMQYCHIKVGYERNWDKFPRVLSMLTEAHKSGLDITADVYAYTYSSTDLSKTPFVPSISEENLELALAHPLVAIASDSGMYAGMRATHPRAYGNVPRFLGHYVREKKLLSLEAAVAKLTSLPARRLGLTDRGLIKEGYQADLVLFDPATIIDKATREKPSVFSEGVRQVWVNGNLAWADGKLLNDSSGRPLKKK